MKQPSRHRRLSVSGRKRRQVRRQQIRGGDNALDRSRLDFSHERVTIGMDRAESVIQTVVDTVLCIKNDKPSSLAGYGGFMRSDDIRRHDAAVGTAPVGFD